MSWIDYTELPQLPNRTTKSWRLTNKGNSSLLGFVGWETRFRKYAFYPTTGTVHDWNCLREIADFTEEKTREHMSKT